MKKTKKFMLDDERRRVYAGDYVHFTYGITPTPVNAKVVLRSGNLVALTPHHLPKQYRLRNLRKFVGSFYKS